VQYWSELSWPYSVAPRSAGLGVLDTSRPSMISMSRRCKVAVLARAIVRARRMSLNCVVIELRPYR
jgi:hypothetical protein